MKYLTLVVLALAACALPDDTTGSVYEITNLTVTIRGNFSPGTLEARPASSLPCQAEELCSGAWGVCGYPGRGWSERGGYWVLCR